MTLVSRSREFDCNRQPYAGLAFARRFCKIAREDTEVLVKKLFLSGFVVFPAHPTPTPLLLFLFVAPPGHWQGQAKQTQAQIWVVVPAISPPPLLVPFV
jgi:hypothetical protein